MQIKQIFPCTIPSLRSVSFEIESVIFVFILRGISLGGYYDGRWHHVCIFWRNKDGSWKLFVDDVIIDSGSNFQTGHVIKGGGVIIIGQIKAYSLESRVDFNILKVLWEGSVEWIYGTSLFLSRRYCACTKRAAWEFVMYFSGWILRPNITVTSYWRTLPRARSRMQNTDLNKLNPTISIRS